MVQREVQRSFRQPFMLRDVFLRHKLMYDFEFAPRGK